MKGFVKQTKKQKRLAPEELTFNYWAVGVDGFEPPTLCL